MTAVVAALGLAVLKPDFSDQSGFGRFLLQIEDNPWPVVGIGLFAAVVLGNLLRNMHAETG